MEQLSKLNLYGLADEGTADAQRKETLGYLVKLRETVPAAAYEHCLELFQDSSQMPPRYNGPLCVIHGDLLPGHILVDAGAGRVRGIIDWSDAALSDPMGDFVGLWMWRGEDFVEEVLKRYRCPVNSGAGFLC